MFLIDRRYIRSFDWISFIIMLMLSAIGLLFVFSSTYKPDIPYSLFFKKQLFGIISGLAIYCTCCFFDYRTVQRWGYFMYFATIALLICTIIKGSIGMGAQRWINLGIVKFQPSELAKFFLPSFISFYLSTEKELLTNCIQEFLPILSIIALSSLLIIKQPDLGTAIIVLFSGISMLWLAGIGKNFFIYSFIIFILATPLVWKCLKPYQRKRIEVFLGNGDRKKERYQLEQSKIAIGSGGLLGKGFLLGTQNKLMFLPESRTDFIFSVICEEWGFLGALCIISLYFMLFIRFYYVIASIKNFFAQLLASGLVIHIVLSAIINMCMVSGLLPIVGIPLPFLSYGISNLWITFASLGCFNSIALRRFYLSMSAARA